MERDGSPGDLLNLNIFTFYIVNRALLVSYIDSEKSILIIISFGHIRCCIVRN